MPTPIKRSPRRPPTRSRATRGRAATCWLRSSCRRKGTRGDMGIEVQRRGTRAALAAAIVAMALGSAHATTLLVDDDNVQCPSAPYHTINQALAALNPGDDILVCVGTYAEQVVLTQSVPIR